MIKFDLVMLVLNRNTYLGNVVDANQSEGFCIGRVRYDQNGSFDEMHCHENPHLSLVVSGGNIENRKNISFERLPGRVTFYHSGEAHQNSYRASGSSHINIEITPSWLQRHSLDTISVRSQLHPDAAMLILRMYKESLIGDDFSADTIKLLLFELLTHNKFNVLHKPSWVHVLEELLNDRWNETPVLQDLSTATGVHPITISKHFNRYFGCTLGQYMRKLKVSRAIVLMKTNETNLTDIAYECGFADQSHFIRTFKQLTGLLPGEYQRL